MHEALTEIKYSILLFWSLGSVKHGSYLAKILTIKQSYYLYFIICYIACSLFSCASAPPKNINNICEIFKQYPNWYKHSHDVENRWQIPIPIQMAIIHQESKFHADAKPKRQKLLWIIPWSRPSTAYGYSQALNSTWDLYKKAPDGGNFWVARNVFAHAVDFIGWYANQANHKAGVPRTDPYKLYLAYHEGITGFIRKSYLNKPWLIMVAQKVKMRAQIFQDQLQQCKTSY